MTGVERLNAYVAAVMAGDLVVSSHVKQAVQRHVDDIHDGIDRGLMFDAARANVVIGLIELLKHSIGKLAGRVFQ